MKQVMRKRMIKAMRKKQRKLVKQIMRKRLIKAMRKNQRKLMKKVMTKKGRKVKKPLKKGGKI